MITINPELPFDVLSLGEILLRLSSSENERIIQGDTFNKCIGGAELNVVSGLSMLGLKTGIISKIPKNDLGIYVINNLRLCGVSDGFISYDMETDARLGLYFYENGAYPRKSSVIYDRKHSSVNKLVISDIPSIAFHSTRLFHTCGISLAISEQTQKITEQCIMKFKENGTLISFDVNFRANLWDEVTARQSIERILPFVDILFISEETSRRTFKKTGTMKQIMKSFATEYNISFIATTERKVHSPKRHDFGSTIYSFDMDTYYTEAPYENIEVIDRIGSGDAYVSGVLYGLLTHNDCQSALEIGNAACAIKNTVPGDLPSTNLSEIRDMIAAHHIQGDQSEMKR